MPITKILEPVIIKPVQTPNAENSRSTKEQNSALDNNPFFKLRSTGLLQEHLRRDATGTATPTNDHERSEGLPTENLSQALNSLRKVSISEGHSGGKNYILSSGSRRNSTSSTINTGNNDAKSNLFSIKTRSRANSEFSKLKLDSFEGNRMSATKVAQTTIKESVEVIETKQIGNITKYQAKSRSDSVPSEVEKKIAADSSRLNPPPVSSEKKSQPSSEPKALSEKQKAKDSPIERVPSLRNLTLARKNSERELNEFNLVVSRIKSKSFGSLDRLAANETDTSTAKSIKQPTANHSHTSSKEILQNSSASTLPKEDKELSGQPSVRNKDSDSSSKTKASGSKSSSGIEKKLPDSFIHQNNMTSSLNSLTTLDTNSKNDYPPGTPGQARFSPKRVESFKYDNTEESYEVDAILELKEVLQSHLSLNTSKDELYKRKTQKIVTAIASNDNQSEGAITYQEGDVLLVTDFSAKSGWVMARHEASGKSGLVRSEDIREMDSIFADIVALTDDTSNNSASKELRSDSVVSKFDQESRHPQLRELAKNSKFNLSFESDTSKSGRRTRTPTMDDSWSKRVGEEVSQIIDREEKKRQEAIYEYVETEKGFLDDMEMVMEGYYQPLKESRALTETECVNLFSNLAQIIQISSESVQVFGALQSSMNGIIEDVGELLLRELPKLKEYAPFCSNLSRAVHFVSEKKKASPQFQEKLAECAKNPYFGNMDLNSYLLKPMQRITKIPLLIKGILKYTRKDSPDIQFLTEAEAVSQEILLFINSKCGEADEMRKLLKIQKKLNFDLIQELGLDFLDEKKRHILHGGQVDCNDKKISMFLFEDYLLLVSSKISNKIERFSLFRPIASLWLIEINVVDSSPRQPYLRKQSSRLIASIRSQREPAKSFTLYDPQVDGYYEISTATAREKDSWINSISTAQQQLFDSAKYTIDRYKALPVLPPSSKTKKSQTTEYNSGLRIGKYMLISHNEGLIATTDDGTSNFLECPGFNNRVGQIYIDENFYEVFEVIQDKSCNVEAYSIDGIMLLLNYMFDDDKSDGASPPGMKVIKLPGSKGTNFCTSGMLNDIPHIVAAANKTIMTYQYNAAGKFFKKINDISFSDSSGCHGVTFIKNNLCVGVGNKFFFVDINDSKNLDEISDGTLASQLENSQALACCSISDRTILLCYDNIGVLVDISSKPYKTEKYYVWKLLAVKFALQLPYILVYSKNFVEVWNIKRGTMRQIIYAPNLRVLDPTRMLITQSDSENPAVLSMIRLINDTQSQ